MSHGHHWEYCELCERDVVICGACGNNSCNSGYGELPDGSTCTACPSAYELDMKGPGVPSAAPVSPTE